jgi:hypothetical protein
VHCCEHLLGESGDEEVEEPVAGCCGGLRQGSEVGIEEFLFNVNGLIFDISLNDLLS